MRLVYCNRIKSLIYFFLLSFSSISFSNPIVSVFESAVIDSLVTGGMTSEQAAEDASKITNSIFDKNLPANLERWGMTENSSVADYFFSKGSTNSINFKENAKRGGVFSDDVTNSLNNPHLKGGEGVMFHVENHGNWEDRKKLEQMFKDRGFSLVFKTSIPYREIEQYADMVNEYAIAPSWYDSTGMFLYRTELPINKDGDYFYADKPFVFYRQGLIHFIKNLEIKETLVDIGEKNGKVFRFPIYKDEPFTYEDEQDAGLEFIHSYGNHYSLNYLYERKIWDRTDDLEADLGYIKLDMGFDGEPEAIVNKLREFAAMSEFSEEGVGTLLLTKNRDDISNEEDTIKMDDTLDMDDRVSVYDDLKSISDYSKSSERLDNYEATPETISKIFNKEIKDFNLNLKQEDKEKLSPQARNLLSSAFVLTPQNVATGARRAGLTTTGGGGISVKDLSNPVSTFKTFFTNNSDRRSIPIGVSNNADIAHSPSDSDRNKPKPVGAGANGGTSGTNSGSIPGSNTGIGSGSSSNTDVTTGSGAGAIPTSNTQTNAGSVTVGTSASSATDKPEETPRPEALPLIPDALDILKPLTDWRLNLISYLQISPASGTCPTFQFDFIDGSQISIDTHCIVFEKISQTISLFMSAVWAILAFRVLFSA